MPWTAEVTAGVPSPRDKLKIRWTVVYTLDGKPEAVDFETSTKEERDQIVIGDLAQRNRITALVADPSLGAVDTKPAEPSADVKARDAFLGADRFYRRLLDDVSVGYLAADNPSVSDAKAAALALYDPEYRR